jgi:hypothetical protein
MALEFEKLSEDVENMGRHALYQQGRRGEQLTMLRAKLRAYATDWESVERALNRALDQVDEKLYRSARPLPGDHQPLDEPRPLPPCPGQATLVATDGSQIMPDRHAAFLYYVINIGGIVYYHGRGRTPTEFTLPTLADLVDEPPFGVSSGVVSARRDLAEITALAESVAAYANETRPLLALLDQRLLYWPAGGLDQERHEVLLGWQAAMTAMREQGGLLAGYIDRPGKNSVVTLLQTLDIGRPGFDPATLCGRGEWLGITDAFLYSDLLPPGHRSKLFVEISAHNNNFRLHDPANEVCFFYLNAGRSGRQIARVDIPMWVAQEAGAVDAVHALVYDQCQVLGGYPYVLARADELAVISRQDQAELDNWIALVMQRHEVDAHLVGGAITAKQSSKEVARAGRTRHEV